MACRIIIRLALELVGNPYDLPASFNTSRLTIRLVDGCSKELAGKSYDILASSNASRITKRLVDGCSEGSRCIFSALNCVKLQRGPSEHPSTSRTTIRLALELVGKSYDFSASSTASLITIRIADGCSKSPHCVFSALNCVKLQRGPFEHPSASRITIRLALELANKPYDLPASSNAIRITKRLADGCSKDPRCVFSALECVKLQRGPSEHPSASRITIRLALELAGKPYDLPASFNASRLTIRLADSALDCVKLQRGPSEHPSTSRITIRLALKLANKPYDLPANSNASRIIKWIANGCSKGPRCVFTALNYVKLQSGPSEHTSASCITIRLALELVRNPYDLPASSNASRLTIRLVDGWSEGPRCVFSALYYVKLQHEPSEHPSTSRITIRLALELAEKPYDLLVSSNARCITKRLADGRSEGLRCVFSALGCIKLERGPCKHPSASRITIRLALELVGKPYDLPASSNASWLTIQFADGCSEGSHCVFSALNCVKLQRGSFEHTSASHITIRFALELASKPYDLPANSNASRIIKRLVDFKLCKVTMQNLKAHVRNPYEDNVKTFSQALVAHFQDNMDNEDEDGDDDEDEDGDHDADDDIDVTGGTSEHDHGPHDDDNQDDPPSGIRPSIGGATTKPSNPPSSQLEPPPLALEGDIQEDMGGASHGGGRQTKIGGKEIIPIEESIGILTHQEKHKGSLATLPRGNLRPLHQF
ncbi:hypothetical protein L7F22_007911 [Adiantum nelumboides]|nr:hypothetical protein [Adiantum nelumboides]